MASERAPIGLALLGGAHIHTAGFITSLLRPRDDITVRWVWDHDASRAARWARELGATATPHLEAVLSDDDVAGVIICSETNRHHHLAVAAAAAHKHVFVEKPLAGNAVDALAITEAVERAGIIFNIGYYNRTLPHALFLKEEIARGTFGTITHVHGASGHAGALEGWFDGDWRWMAIHELAGVGAFGDVGTHPLDVLMWLVGDVAAVTADIKSVTDRYGDCDEAGEALLQFTNGITGSLGAGWVDIANPITFMVCGTAARAVVWNGHVYFTCPAVLGADGQKPWRKLPRAESHPLVQFIEAIAGDPRSSLIAPREAAARVIVMEAAYHAARTGTWTNLAATEATSTSAARAARRATFAAVVVQFANCGSGASFQLARASLDNQDGCPT